MPCSGVSPAEAAKLDAGPGGEGEALAMEAEAINRVVFGEPVEEAVLKRYVEAHASRVLHVSAEERRWMREVLRKRLDLEALEVVLRLRRPNHVLIRKFKALLFISESSPRSFDAFVNMRSSRFRACLAMLYHALRTIYKIVKGLYLLRWHRPGA